jgi:hypothetical protein
MKFAILILTFLFCSAVGAQTIEREFIAAERPQISLQNTRGTVRVVAEKDRESTDFVARWRARLAGLFRRNEKAS